MAQFTSDPILEIKNLKKTYPNGVKALNGINLKVYQGEFLVVIGLSGSGKSTFLRCLNRLVEPTEGSIYFQNQDTTHYQGIEIKELRKSISMIFQQFNLIGRFSVLKNVLTGALSRTSTLKSLLGIFTSENENMAKKYLNLVGLVEKVNIRADQLSGGQMQRVAIARALTQNPKILLADEPVASLDPATCHIVMDYLKKINQELGLTVICNLHFLSLVRKYATRVIALKDGNLVFEGNPNEITKEWFERIYGEGTQEVHIQ